MNDLLSKISNSELQILKALWKTGTKMSLPEIRKALAEKTGWESSTIKTLLYRLRNKGIVLAEKENIYYYTPLITEQDYNDFVAGDIVDRIYEGSAKNLVASLINTVKLREEDIEDLRELLKGGGLCE